MPAKPCYWACIKLMIIASSGPIMLPGKHTRFSQGFSLFHLLLDDCCMSSVSSYVHRLFPTINFDSLASYFRKAIGEKELSSPQLPTTCSGIHILYFLSCYCERTNLNALWFFLLYQFSPSESLSYVWKYSFISPLLKRNPLALLFPLTIALFHLNFTTKLLERVVYILLLVFLFLFLFVLKPVRFLPPQFHQNLS